MNSTSYLTPTVQIASPCYLIKKKKRRKKEHEIYTYIYLKPRRERWNNKNIFSIEWKKEKKKRNILFENVRQHDTIGTLRFFFHGSRLRFSLFIARPCFQPLHICAWLLPMKSVLEKKRVCERERRDSMKRERKIEIENSDEEDDEYPSKGDIFVSSEEEYPQYTRVMTDNYFEGFGTKKGSWRGRGRIRRRRKACKPRKW